MYGGSIFLAYQIINDYQTHHDEASGKPTYLNHLLATTLIGTGLGALKFSTPLQVFSSGFFSFMLVGPIIWWLGHQAKY